MSGRGIKIAIAITKEIIPLIIKLLEGTQGVGVILAETTKAAQAIVETLHSTQHNVLIQKFVAESKGRDVRAHEAAGRIQCLEDRNLITQWQEIVRNSE